MSTDSTEIRTILAGMSVDAILVPGSVVAEVVDYSAPKPYKDTPGWLLGATGWADWSVPVISFATLAGKTSAEEATANSRILIIKSLSGSSTTPYLGILINGVPRMIKVTAKSLTKPKQLSDFPSVFREVTIDDKQAMIPDLDELTRLVQESVGDQ